MAQNVEASQGRHLGGRVPIGVHHRFPVSAKARPDAPLHLFGRAVHGKKFRAVGGHNVVNRADDVVQPQGLNVRVPRRPQAFDIINLKAQVHRQFSLPAAAGGAHLADISVQPFIGDMPVCLNSGFFEQRPVGAESDGAKALVKGGAAHGFHIVPAVAEQGVGMQGRKSLSFGPECWGRHLPDYRQGELISARLRVNLFR